MLLFRKENKIDRIDLVPAAGKNVDELQADVQKTIVLYESKRIGIV